MNKKRILVSMLTVGVMLGCSNFAYASEASMDTTKVAIETTEVGANQVETISDEKAVEIASDAMKYYLNKDVSSFKGTEIDRFNHSEEGVASTIFVHFKSTENDEEIYKDNEVTIDSTTGEVIRISREKELVPFKGEVDKTKIKEAILNVLDKANLKPDNEINLDKIYVEAKCGVAWLYVYVDGGKVADVEIDLEDYSLINFYKSYKIYPNEKWEDLMIS